MTYLDLATIHFLRLDKQKKLELNDLTDIIFVVTAIKRQPERLYEILNDDINNILKNISRISKKYVFLKNFISKFQDKFSLKEFSSIAFVCWYSYNVLDFKKWQKNTIEDFSNELQDNFRNWYKNLNNNVHIIHGFKQSCKNIFDLRNDHESSTQCILRLLSTDKLAQTYYSGEITSYFLGAIPEDILLKNRTSTFSNQLIDLISKNRELLCSKLNNAARNYMGVPVNSIKYLNDMFE